MRYRPGMKARNERHLDFIRRCPCCICGTNLTIDPCHVRYTDYVLGKYNAMGRKPRGPGGEEYYVVPMCRYHHDMQHRTSERAWWYAVGRDPHELSQALWDHSGDMEAAERLICDFRERN